MEEIGEAMAEQKRRLQETEEDDYFDNDAGLDYDEAAPEEIDDPGPVNKNIVVGPAAKPILKTEPSEPTPRKSVRFSLTPAVASTLQPPSASSASASPSVCNSVQSRAFMAVVSVPATALPLFASSLTRQSGGGADLLFPAKTALVLPPEIPLEAGAATRCMSTTPAA